MNVAQRNLKLVADQTVGNYHSNISVKSAGQARYFTFSAVVVIEFERVFAKSLACSH
jgi:hypothetical protein